MNFPVTFHRLYSNNLIDYQYSSQTIHFSGVYQENRPPLIFPLRSQSLDPVMVSRPDYSIHSPSSVSCHLFSSLVTQLLLYSFSPWSYLRTTGQIFSFFFFWHLFLSKNPSSPTPTSSYWRRQRPPSRTLLFRQHWRYSPSFVPTFTRTRLNCVNPKESQTIWVMVVLTDTTITTVELFPSVSSPLIRPLYGILPVHRLV